MQKKTCSMPCEVFSRCVGYFRPVKYWSKGKKEEFKDRKLYSVQNAIGKIETKKEELVTK